MSRIIGCLLMVILAETHAVQAADEDFFSAVSGSSVYENAGAAPQTRRVRRMTDAASLRKELNAAGFDAAVVGKRAAGLKKDLDDRTFPVLVKIAEDEQTVTILVGLLDLPDAAALSTDRLLKMMEVSQKNAPATLAYSTSRKRIEIYTAVPNRDLTGEDLRDTINRMVIVARDHADVWNISNAAPSRDGDTGDSKPDSASDTQNERSTLTGLWSAAISKTSAFALQLQPDGTFRLAYADGQQSTVSSGKYQLTGDRLVLNGADGTTLAGKVNVESAVKFVLTPDGGSPLNFVRAKSESAD